jgi:EpsI family protein
MHRDIEVPVARPLQDLPGQVGEWVQTDDFYFSDAVMAQLRPTDYVYRVYRHTDNDAGVSNIAMYIGYHGGGPESGPIHSPKHCLPGSGWTLEGEEVHTLEGEEESLKVVEAVYRNGDHRELFIYWYQVRGRTLTSEYALKMAEILNSMLYERRDSAFIRISTRYRDGDDKPVALLRDFVRRVYPFIKEVLPQ